MLGVFCSSLLVSHLANAEVAVIVNSANSSAISDTEISRLFLGKLKKYSAGDKAVPINQKFGSAIRKEFEKKVLKKSSTQVKAYWSKRVFSGKGKPPKELTSDKDILAQISANKNAIGYIDAASINDSVKVIRKF
ncbi:MAG: phosphate ABC transporter substrate-binding protein [Alteromonadaceae bacterium]|nr:phosphate ABC transporter substrate-binding protein [Alteromonadaceae bacterium]